MLPVVMDYFGNEMDAKMCNLTDGYLVMKWVLGGLNSRVYQYVTVVRRPRKETGRACY